MPGLPSLLLALAVAGADLENKKLEAGIETYRTRDHAAALRLLVEALEVPSSRAERAQIRLYIGLVQIAYGRLEDAESSFVSALELDPGIRAPHNAPKEARALLAEVRAALGVETPAPGRRRTRPSSAPRPARRALEPSAADLLPPSDSDSPDVPRADVAAARTDQTRGPAGRDLSLVGPPPAERAAPILTWVAAGAGATASAAGIALGILARASDGSARTERDPDRANALHDRAVGEHRASVVSFGVSGALFGVAIVSLLVE